MIIFVLLINDLPRVLNKNVVWDCGTSKIEWHGDWGILIMFCNI